MSGVDADLQRSKMLARWERAAAGWSRRADTVQETGMRVSVWMLERLELQPGQQVLELACGPGDTGFMAAELVKPGGSLISSDASPAMLGVARGRARDLGVTNVEFKQLQLEWIDLEAASVDAALCRWGLMFVADPGAALREVRRVLRPGGRLTLAVWDTAEENAWATIPTRALVELDHVDPPDPSAPGMFMLADRERLGELLSDSGFTEVVVDSVTIHRSWESVTEYIAEVSDLSGPFAEARARLSDAQWQQVQARITELATPFQPDGGSLQMPGKSLVAAASA